ncbi:hypothetical protein RA210_U10370 [Rubrivivax sp. A210]|nr:hypothetical protein RA210_U10370 [Rubrivivax sp. A210]
MLRRPGRGQYPAPCVSRPGARRLDGGGRPLHAVALGGSDRRDTGLRAHCLPCPASLPAGRRPA